MSIPNAVLTLIRAALTGVTVYDSRVPDSPEDATTLPSRYVAVYPDDGTRSIAEAVQHESTSVTYRWQTTCVAPDREMAAWLAGKVKDALVDVRPTVDGWSPGLIEHTFSQLPRPDEQVQERPVVVAIDQFQLVAERLPSA